MSLGVESPKENIAQLGQWNAILRELRTHGFQTGDTKYEKPSYGILQAPVQCEEEDFYLRTSLIGDYPFSEVRLLKPILPSQDFAILPDLPRPKYITIAFDETEFSGERAGHVREYLSNLGQKIAFTSEVNSRSRIEFPYELKDGKYRIKYIFQQESNRRNCSFEMDARDVKNQFELGMFPYHIDQTKADDKHYCIAAPTIPLIPVSLNGKINEFVIFYENLYLLSEDRFDELFKNVTLPGKFSIFYGDQPGVSISARYGGEYLGISVHETRRINNVSVLDPTEAANGISDNLNLFKQFYSSFQSF